MNTVDNALPGEELRHDGLLLVWLNARPGVTSPIIGANSVAQLEANLAEGDVTITDEHKKRVDDRIPSGTHTEDDYRTDWGPHPHRV